MRTSPQTKRSAVEVQTPQTSGTRENPSEETATHPWENPQAIVAVNSSSSPTPEAAWPSWALAIAGLVILVATLCAIRLILRVFRDVGAMVRRKIPARLVWVFRSSPAPTRFGRIGRIVLFYVLAAAMGAGVTEWILTHPAESRAITTPTFVRVPMPAPLTSPTPSLPAPPATPAIFVHTVVPALERCRLTHGQAVLFAAHLARETGWGRWVSHHNYGNIKTGGWTGASFLLTDRRGFRGRYRAYPSATEGLEGAISLIRDSSRYRKAWTLLQRGNLHWYGQLGLDGYYEGPPDREARGQHTTHTLATIEETQREYEGIVSLVRRYDAGGRT